MSAIRTLRSTNQMAGSSASATATGSKPVNTGKPSSTATATATPNPGTPARTPAPGVPPTLAVVTSFPDSFRMAASDPIVSISENGQMSLNSLAGKALAGCVSAVFLADLNGTHKDPTTGLEVADRKSNWIGIQGLLGTVTGTGESRVVTVTDPKAKQYPENIRKSIQWAKGGGTNPIISAALFLRLIQYDFNASGRQPFTPANSGLVLDAKNHTVYFQVPSGSLTPLPKEQRAPRVKKDAGATAGAQDVPVDGGEGVEMEPELELAEAS